MKGTWSHAGMPLAASLAFVLLSCGDPTDNPAPAPRDVDLTPCALAASDSQVHDGGALDVTLRVQNLAEDAPGSGFSAMFHLAATSAFDPGHDPVAGTTTITGGPGGGETMDVTATITVPDNLDVNQCMYLYACVDCDGEVEECDEGNNMSAVDCATVILVWDDENAGRTYPLLVETYSPSGAGTADTVIALYSSTGAFIASDNYGGPSGYASLALPAAGPGTLFVLAASWTPGPYAFAVRTAGIGRPAFTELASDADDPGEDDDLPFVVAIEENLVELPSTPVAMVPGQAMNRYAATSDWDWFAVTLP